jgi:hypothetical protein
MKPTRTRRAAVAVALSTIAIAAPESTACAATAAPAVTLPPAGPGLTVIGPTIITTAPGVTFINTNNQVSAGGVWSGGQFAP